MIHAVKNRLLPLILIAVSTAADQVPARKHVQIAEQLIVNRTPINPVTGNDIAGIVRRMQPRRQHYPGSLRAHSLRLKKRSRGCFPSREGTNSENISKPRR